MEKIKETETFLEIGKNHHGHRIYVREIQQQDDNNSETFDVVVVHGGPGLSDHTEILEPFRNGLLPLHVLDNEDNNKKKRPLLLIRRLVFYDQLGCGEKSDKPNDASCYSIEASVNELAAVLVHVNASSSSSSLCSSSKRPNNIVLLGYSWGGQVVLEYLRSCNMSNNISPHHPFHVHGAIISNAPLDEQSYAARQLQIRQGLDETFRAFLEQEEHQSDSIAYKTLIGTSETNITGSMRDWSVLPLLLQKVDDVQDNNDSTQRTPHPFSSRSTPLLLICGEHDTAPCQEYQAVADIHNNSNNNITRPSSNIQAMVLAGADHAPFYGQTKDMYFTTIQQFLTKLIAIQPGHV